MIDYNSIYNYLSTIKHEPWGDFNEYQRLIQETEVSFRCAFTQYAIELDGKRIVLFLKDFEDLVTTLKMELSYMQRSKDNGKINWLSFQVTKAQEAVEYIQRVRADLGGYQEASSSTKEKASEMNKFVKKMSEYGDLLSVNDLTEIFGCSSRTITNWEKKGLVVNVAKTSDEVNTAGKRKRGQEKRYRKDTILRSVFLQERFQSLV